MKQIRYIYHPTKYRLVEDYQAMTGIKGYYGTTSLIHLDITGKMHIKAGYGFDPSGPTIDTKSALRGSLEHDAFYELMRLGLVSLNEFDRINDRLEYVCKQDGMFDIRAEFWDLSLDIFGKSSADPKNVPEIMVAP